MAYKPISVMQYLMGRAKLEDLPPEHVTNINILIPKINELLERYNRPVPMNSGYRTVEDQKRINPKAMKSKHMEGAAIDLGDRDHNLRYFILNNVKILEELDLYMEDPSHTATWIHLQIIPPKSKRRIFIP